MMDKKEIIISETPRPFWQFIIAALLFTCAFFAIVMFFYNFNWDNKYIRSFAEGGLPLIGLLIAGGLSFCSQKRVYVDIENSRFKPSLEIGFIKIGKWKTIRDYEYVSIFFDPSKSESEVFEVNLWYDGNKHFELYTRNNFEDAVSVGFDVSEELNIDLLDATIKGDYKWIDKKALKQDST